MRLRANGFDASGTPLATHDVGSEGVGTLGGKSHGADTNKFIGTCKKLAFGQSFDALTQPRWEDVYLSLLG
jgi:hypothetical protein